MLKPALSTQTGRPQPSGTFCKRCRSRGTAAIRCCSTARKDVESRPLRTSRISTAPTCSGGGCRPEASDIRSSELTRSSTFSESGVDRLLPRAGTPKDLGRFQDPWGPSDPLSPPRGAQPLRAGGGPAITQPLSPPPTPRMEPVMTTPQDEKPAVGNFAELSEADCKELLAQHSAGRIGFMAGDGPQILPVTYQYRNGSVVSVPLRLDLWLGSSVVPVSLLRST